MSKKTNKVSFCCLCKKPVPFPSGKAKLGSWAKPLLPARSQRERRGELRSSPLVAGTVGERISPSMASLREGFVRSKRNAIEPLVGRGRPTRPQEILSNQRQRERRGLVGVGTKASLPVGEAALWSNQRQRGREACSKREGPRRPASRREAYEGLDGVSLAFVVGFLFERTKQKTNRELCSSNKAPSLRSLFVGTKAREKPSRGRKAKKNSVPVPLFQQPESQK